MLLHSFRHKGYWFHGRHREQTTMEFFRRAIRSGDTVVEVGGHIGYMSMFFAELVGEIGRVVVFEPGRNNLPYLRRNVSCMPAVQLIETAVSDRDGTAEFFEEALTGQNNSLLGDYRRFEENRQKAFSQQSYSRTEVKTVRLDTYLRQHQLRPSLIKIDVEGAESLVLAGAAVVLAEQLPVLVVEVTHKASDVFDLLTKLGYRLFEPEGCPWNDSEGLEGNICALHPAKHKELLEPWT